MNHADESDRKEHGPARRVTVSRDIVNNTHTIYSNVYGRVEDNPSRPRSVSEFRYLFLNHLKTRLLSRLLTLGRLVHFSIIVLCLHL